MFLAVDIGNTNTVFALCEGHEIRHSWRCKTDVARTADEYTSWLFSLFQHSNYDFKAIKGVIVSSVVPDANYNIGRMGHTCWNTEPLFAGRESIDIEITLPNPEEVGADRLVNAMAAVKAYGTPAIIIDFGTATTFDVVNKEGAYCGGVIAPGINLSVDALHKAAAKLPRIAIAKPPAVTGKDTVSAMQSGIFWGYTGLIEGLLRRLKQELKGADIKVIATGGLASLFIDVIPEISKADPELTLRGLIHIYHERNN